MASNWSHLGLQLAGRYRLDEPIAHGGLCAVYKGQDTVLRRAISVKAAPPELIESYREALRACASFTYPGVVAIYDAIEHDGWLFLIQEYVAARPFATYLRNGLPTERTLNLSCQIAQALAYAHTRGLAHGDLTPAAVLVDRHAVVRLNNFCLPPDDTYFQEITATLEESARNASAALSLDDGEGDTGATGDIFALGLLMWQALSEPSSNGAREGDESEQDDEARRAFRADVSEPLREIVRRCVDRAHPQRIATAEALTLELDELSQTLARERNNARSEDTPPALRIARDEVAREASWSVRETLGNRRQWMDSLEDSRSNSAPTDPAPRAAEPQGQYVRARQVEVGAPRLRLPSHPQGAPAAQVAATAAPPYWDGYARAAETGDTNPAEAVRQRSGLSVAIVLLLGVALFVAFFFVGLLGPNIVHLP